MWMRRLLQTPTSTWPGGSTLTNWWPAPGLVTVLTEPKPVSMINRAEVAVS